MKYGFIGCGNMGGALAKALSKTTKDILLTDVNPDKAAALAQELGCSWTESNEVVASQCERIFLAVKPQMMADMLGGIADTLTSCAPILISMAAGLAIAQIEDFAGCDLPVIRIMPNTPVAVGKGMITYCCNSLVTQEMLNSFLTDMQYAGTFDAIPEKLIDAATAVAGCTPAYVYMMIEAMADGAVACGLPRDKAMRYAATAVAGSAEMVLSSGKHPGELKDAVCSPAGSTIAGVRVLEENGFRGTLIDCIIAAWERNNELGK